MIGVSNPPGENIARSPRNSIEQQIFCFARSMDNFMYLVGDIRTRECAIVDGCWDPHGIARYAENDGMKLVRNVRIHPLHLQL